MKLLDWLCKLLCSGGSRGSQDSLYHNGDNYYNNYNLPGVSIGDVLEYQKKQLELGGADLEDAIKSIEKFNRGKEDEI